LPNDVGLKELIDVNLREHKRGQFRVKFHDVL